MNRQEIDRGHSYGSAPRTSGVSVSKQIAQSARTLQIQIERHRRLIAVLADGGGISPPEVGCSALDCVHRRTLRETTREAIEVLEASRRAFKSKQLEALRKKLITVLAESD